MKMPKIFKTIAKILNFDMSVKKRWFVNSTEAEYRDGKHGAPNIYTYSEEQMSLESARNDICSRIGFIMTNTANRIEWISWRTNRVEIKFHYNGDSVGTDYKSYGMEIVEISEDGQQVCVDLGW